MNVTDILEDSPNGYRIIADQPIVVDEAIRYYLMSLEKYQIEEFPVEFGIVNYGMGKLLFGDTSKPKISEERAKRIENALYHLNQALLVFNHSDYPSMFGLISIMMAQLFRERATLICNRSFLAERSSPEDSVLYGVDQILEAFPVFYRSKAHTIEHALCSLEAGWLYVLQSEFVDNYREDSLREQAAMYLERAISLVHTISEKASGGGGGVYTFPGDKNKRWDPLTTDPEHYPQHIQLLLEKQPFSYIEGSALYLLGRLYQNWTELNVPEYKDLQGNHDRGRHLTFSSDPTTSSTNNNSSTSAFELQNQIKAFDFFLQAVRAKYLPKECFLWADAHHRSAVTLIKYPKVVNPDYIDNDLNSSDIHLEVAITHLKLALRCSGLTGPAAMDLHFHLAQTAISRLQLIIDRVPLGQSVTVALRAHSEGLELIETVEYHLSEARKRVTPASTQTTQDGYLYFFSCMKISEFRMLEAACKPELRPIERENYLTDAVEHVIDALNARTLLDNTDLHYVATVQMSQLLLAVKRTFAASKSYGKCLFTLSVLINRSLYNPHDVQAKLSEETVRQVGQSLAAGARDVKWVKLHFGPVSLNERLTAGYAVWSFESMRNLKIPYYSSARLDVSTGDDDLYRPQINNNKTIQDMPFVENENTLAEGSSLSGTAIYKASPPKGVPPLKLPTLNQKKVYITGEDMKNIGKIGTSTAGIADDDGLDAKGTKKKPLPPPAGPIPLFAMGHNPNYAHTTKHNSGNSDFNTNEQKQLSLKNSEIASNYYLGPYGRRIRRKIPPTKEMFDIDKNNLLTFGFRNGKPTFLLPRHIKRRVDSTQRKSAASRKSGGVNSKSAKVRKPNSHFTGASKFSPSYNPNNTIISSNIENHSTSDSSNLNNNALLVKEQVEKEEEEEEEEEEEKDDDDDDDDDDNCDVNEGIKTRGRSKSIRPQNNNMNSSTTTVISTNSMQKKKGVMSWLFSNNKKKERAAGEKLKSSGFSLIGMFRGGSSAQSNRNKKLTEEDMKEANKELWASPQCFYTYNVLSRQSRMQLVLRCSRLEALDGERANNILFHTKPKYLNTYYALKKLLTKDCARLVVPPVSMKELSGRPYLELQALFSSQVRICRKLDDLEHLLYNKISKHDSFLPYITCAPVFTRDLAEFDKGLLNAEQLILNLANENTLAAHNMHMQQKEKQEQHVKKQEQGQVEEGDVKSQFAYDSVSSANKSVSTAAVTINTDKQQRLEEAEEVAVGKMTLSLSQCLDGSNYLLNGQQGSRDMLYKFVAEDECLMVWHVPVVPSQHIQVVLIWRDQSASTHEHFSSSAAAKAAAEELEYSRQKNKLNGKSKKVDLAQANGNRKGLIMEIAQSDLDTSHLLQYIQGYVDALHAKSAPMRCTMSTDALRALSCALSLTEFLHMIPPHVKSIVICCPPSLRLVPWHLLLIEQPNNTPFTFSVHTTSPTTPSPLPNPSATADNNKPVEVHMMERFNVRMGPSLSLFELNECGSQLLRHSVGLHRLCAIDGESGTSVGDNNSNNRPTSPMAPAAVGSGGGGIRGSDLEVSCVSNVWSADPDDAHILAYDSAAPKAVQTVLFGESGSSNDDYKMFKQSIHIQRREAVDHVKHAGDTNHFNKTNNILSGSSHDPITDYNNTLSDGRTAEESDREEEKVEDTDDENEDEDSEDENCDNKLNINKNRNKLSASAKDKKALTMCRVLHIASPKVPLSQELIDKKQEVGGVDSGTKVFASIALPRYDQLLIFRDPKYQRKLKKRNRDERLEDERDCLSARDVINQVFVRNCALCTVSRYALCDDLSDVRSAAGLRLCDINCEFIEALHLAGAKTVLHPLWSGSGSGLSALAHLIFQIRFYSTLPAHSKSRLSIVETCRATQTWMRNASADAMIAFVHKAPLPKQARKVIIQELESFVSASLTPAQQALKLEALKRNEEVGSLAAPSKFISPTKHQADKQHSLAGSPSASVTGGDKRKEDSCIEGGANRIGGDVKFFSHFLYWGSYSISGAGAAVHHPDLTENKNEGFEQGHIRWDDKELNNMSYEASMLRLEGKIAEAKELEQLIRQIRMDRIKKQFAAAKATGQRAGRGLMDTLDYLDKALLDPDSEDDQVSVSDDSAEERRKRKQRKQNKARESDSDEYDDSHGDDIADINSGAAGNSNAATSIAGDGPTNAAVIGNARSTKKFVPRALELGSMKPEDIAYEKWKSKVGGLNMIVRDPVLQPKRTTVDNYEYNMMKKVKEAAHKEESQEDYDARMEELYKKKDKSKSHRIKKAVHAIKNEEDLGNSSDDSESAVRKAVRRKQLKNADQESESDYEASDGEEDNMDDKEEDSDDEEGLYEKRKNLRKKKELKKHGKAKKISRFDLAMKEVRGGVRSYSSVVKSITNKVPAHHNNDKTKKKYDKNTGDNGEVDDDAKCVIS